MRPPEFVRHRLAAERERGETFEAAWPRALAAVPRRAPERAGWIEALRWAEAEFRAAYDRREGESSPLREEVLLAA